MAETVRHPEGSDGIDRGVLDSVMAGAGRRQVRGMSGQRTTFQECAREKDRRGRLPMVAVSALGWFAAGSYRPEQAICGVRTLLRYRGELIRFAAEHIQHMQKALEQMNVKLGHVISDVTGVSGLAIIDAILAGERDLRTLAKLRDPRVRASEETIIKALEGDYRLENLITLQYSLDLYRHYQKKIGELDKEMEAFKSELPDRIDIGKYPLPPRKKKSRPKQQHNAPAFDLRTHCYRILG